MNRPGIIPTTPLPKVIAATLDMLPHERSWDNDEFEEWLEMFVGACRVWYRLPSAQSREAVERARTGATDTAGKS